MSPTFGADLLPPWLFSLWADDQTRLALLLIGAAALLFVLLPGKKQENPASHKTAKSDRPLRQRRQPWHRRLKLWWAHKLDQPYYWKIGRWVADLNQTHGLVVGGSGSGKSTLVVNLILQPTIGLKMWLMRRLRIWERRPVLIISFDRSDPIEEATNVLEDQGVAVTRWRVRQTNGWDMLQGDAEMIAEALPTGWPSGDNTGFFQQLATDAISAALNEQDAEVVPRDFADMIARMDRIMADDPETPDLARRTWVRRFRSLSRVMGDSIGSDFDLRNALKPGAVVHLSSNSYTNPALTPLVGAMAITHTKLVADAVPTGGYLVLEEASFLKKRADLMDDVAKSMRARGWRIIYLNQDPCAVGDALQVNFGVAVFMGLGPLAVKARQWCADVVKEFPGAFRAAEIVLGATIDQLEGYVLLRGRCRDVSLAPYITRAAEHRRAVGRPRPEPTESAAEPVDVEIDSVVDSLEAETTSGTVFVPEPVVEGPPSMPQHWRGDAQLENIWLHHAFPGGPNGCHVSTYRLNNRGRPMCSYQGVDWMAYMLSLALADRLNLGEVKMRSAAGELTVDHLCQNIRCTRQDHLTWESRSRNSELLHERRRNAPRPVAAH